MRMNHIVLRAACPLANFQRGFDVLEFRAVPRKVQDIDLMLQNPELFDLLHHERAGTLIALVGIHRCDDQDFQAHLEPRFISTRPF